MTNDQSRNWLTLGCVMGGLGVAIGAFGAHGLETAVEKWYEPEEAIKALETWEVGVRYLMYHAFAILVVAILMRGKAKPSGPRPLWVWSCRCFLLGTLVFSGLLFAIVLTGISKLGMIVPIGGLLLIVGWSLAAVGAWRIEKIDQATSE